MSTLSYQFGYCLGVIAHQTITTLRSLQQQPNKQDKRLAPDMLEICRTPSLTRTGVNLNQWYEKNVSICAPSASKPRRIRKKALPKRSSLDVLL
jgi:hypothetical protein